jgi:hypothetical protein
MAHCRRQLRLPPPLSLLGRSPCLSPTVGSHYYLRVRGSVLSTMGETRALAFAEQARSRFAFAVHELCVAAPGAEGDQARVNTDVTDR